MKTKVRAGLVGMVVLLLAAGACDGNDAPQKCEDLLNLGCQRLIECGLETSSQTDCVAEGMTGVSCASAVSVDSTFDACMSQLRVESCNVLVSSGLPAACKGVINVPAPN